MFYGHQEPFGQVDFKSKTLFENKKTGQTVTSSFMQRLLGVYIETVFFTPNCSFGYLIWYCTCMFIIILFNQLNTCFAIFVVPGLEIVLASFLTIV